MYWLAGPTRLLWMSVCTHLIYTNGPALRAMSPLTIHAGVFGRDRTIPVGAVCVGATGHHEKHACPAIYSHREPQRRTFAVMRTAGGNKNRCMRRPHGDIAGASCSAMGIPTTRCMRAMSACLRHLREATRKDGSHCAMSCLLNNWIASACMLSWRALQMDIASAQCHGTTPNACHSAQYIGPQCSLQPSGRSASICCWSCGTNR